MLQRYYQQMLHGGLQNTWNQTTPDMGSVTGDIEQTWNQSTPDVSDVTDAAEATATDGKGWFPTDPVNGVQDTAEDIWSGTTGVLDDTAGSTDEAVGRQFDATEGGGIWDGFASIPDHLSGSIDEAVGRQFDNTRGGGVFDIGNLIPGFGNPIGPGNGGSDGGMMKWVLIGALALGLVAISGGI